MVAVLEPHLELIEHGVDADLGQSVVDRREGVSDLARLHCALYEALERHLGMEGILEHHRPLVPLFQRWTVAARRIVAAASELRALGHRADGIDELAKVINRAKPMAEAFDHYVDLNRRIARGEDLSPLYRPLEKVVDERRP